MVRMRNLASLVALIAACWAGGAVGAPDKPKPVPSRQLTGLFPPDPPGVWRTVTQTDSTSDCIGETVTPMCGVDTRVACFVRRDDSLCSAVSPDPDTGSGFSAPSPNYYRDYRVVTVHRTRAETVEPLSVYYSKSSAHYPEYKRKIGDILIGVILRSCWLPEKNCITSSIPRTFIFRRFGERWLLVDLYWLRY